MKTDAKGRVRVPAERREALLLDEFERSSLSGMKFAAVVGVKYATFAYWLARRRKVRAQIKAAVDLEPRQVELCSCRDRFDCLRHSLSWAS